MSCGYNNNTVNNQTAEKKGVESLPVARPCNVFLWPCAHLVVRLQVVHLLVEGMHPEGLAYEYDCVQLVLEPGRVPRYPLYHPLPNIVSQLLQLLDDIILRGTVFTLHTPHTQYHLPSYIHTYIHTYIHIICPHNPPCLTQAASVVSMTLTRNGETRICFD